MSELLSLDDDFNPDDRVLCPDEACIGILDESGHCKECGMQGSAAQSPARQTGSAAAAPAVTASADTDSADDSATAASAAAPAPADSDGDDFADRQLCCDPLCIGVLDPTGRCKECGRASTLPPS